MKRVPHFCELYLKELSQQTLGKAYLSSSHNKLWIRISIQQRETEGSILKYSQSSLLVNSDSSKNRTNYWETVECGVEKKSSLSFLEGITLKILK